MPRIIFLPQVLILSLSLHQKPTIPVVISGQNPGVTPHSFLNFVSHRHTTNPRILFILLPKGLFNQRLLPLSLSVFQCRSLNYCNTFLTDAFALSSTHHHTDISTLLPKLYITKKEIFLLLSDKVQNPYHITLGSLLYQPTF